MIATKGKANGKQRADAFLGNLSACSQYVFATRQLRCLLGFDLIRDTESSWHIEDSGILIQVAPLYLRPQSYQEDRFTIVGLLGYLFAMSKMRQSFAAHKGSVKRT